MLTLNEALAIAEKAHAGQIDKAGGPYIDFLKSIADDLKSKGESEEVQVLAVLQDLLKSSTQLSKEDIIQMGVPAELADTIQKMTYFKDQSWIDEYSCKLMAEGVPAEEATYEAREKEFVNFVKTLKTNPVAAKAKAAILRALLEDKYIHRGERRELKTKFRLKKYQAAIEALEE